MKNKRISKNVFRIRLLITTLKEVGAITWISLIIAIAGVLNYEGRLIPLTIDTKLTRAINALIEQILITYITGLLLYFLIEMLYKTKKKIAIYVSVVNNVKLITDRVDYLVNEIGKTNFTEINEFSLTDKQFADCCVKIDIDTQMVSVWYYPTLTFRNFTIKSCEEIKVACQEILDFSDLFDERWAYSLSKISGLSSKIVKSMDIRFSKPMIESYHVWGLYAERIELDKLVATYDEHYFQLERSIARPFFPPHLTFRVERKK